MTSIAIVAIPEDTDPVWKMSSEKIPHITLLYGEGPLRDEEGTIQFVKHVVDGSMTRFGLSVNRRGTLGDKDADVLFFDKMFTENLRNTRAFFLANEDLAVAYQKAEQFPNWTPHLTLGYPDAPAKENPNDYSISWVNFDRIAIWTGDFTGPEFDLGNGDNMELDVSMSDIPGFDSFMHSGTKGMKWGVRRDERNLGIRDQALNLSQRSQVKIANSISTLASVGLATNAAAAGFQLQARFEHLKVVNALIDQAQNNPLLSDASREGLKAAKNHVVKGLVASAAATTAVTFAIGIISTRTAKAYFAPLHKAYGDVKPKINADLKALSKDIKKGKRPSLTVKDYNAEVSAIVAKHLTADKNNILSPFHELARSQLGTEFNSKDLNIKLEKLPNTDLYDKITILTPNGLKLVKSVKRVKHADSDPDVGNIDMFFDYKFDEDGYVSDWSCPTIEIANDMFEGVFDMEEITSKYGDLSQSTFDDSENLEHFGFGDLKKKANEIKDGAASGKKKFTESTVVRDLGGQFSKQAGKASDSTEKALEESGQLAGKSKKEIAAFVSNFLSKNVSFKTESSNTSDINGLTGSYEIDKNGKEILKPSPEALKKWEKSLKQSEMAASILADDELMHFGKLGMKWGVRRSTGSSGLVEGTVAGAIKSGQKPSAGTDTGSVKNGKKSADHKKMEKVLSRNVESLSTADIKALTSRLKAINEHKAASTAQKLANRSIQKKILTWAWDQAIASGKKQIEAQMQAIIGEGVGSVLPKTNAQKAQKAKDQQNEADAAKKKADSEQKDVVARSKTAQKAQRSKDGALKDLVYEISSMPKVQKKED